MKYRTSGKGTPVILIHGFPLSSEIWNKQEEALSKEGFQVILPNLYGFGDRSSSKKVSTISHYSEGIINLMDKLKIDKAFIGGMSMGGYITLDLMKHYPTRFFGAGLFVTRSDGDNIEAKNKRDALIDAVESGKPKMVWDAFISLMFAKNAGRELDPMRQKVYSWMSQSTREGLTGALQAIRDREDSTPFLTSVNIPTLIIGANEDQAIPCEFSQKLAKNISGSQLQIIENAGHMVNMEQPESFNRILLEFLKKLS